MNYVAFKGISDLDNLYTSSVRNMEAKEILLDDMSEEVKSILSFTKIKENSEIKEIDNKIA